MPGQDRRPNTLLLTLVLVLLASASGCHLIFTYEGRDAGVPGEAGSDACLPIPANQVKGEYTGIWTGVYSYPGSPPWNISGTLALDMKPMAGGESFQVSGKMSGVADKIYILEGDVKGSMGCRELSATMERISVTFYISVIPVTYYVKGPLKGIFHAPVGAKQGFKDGTWSATEIGGPGSAKGTWSATAK